MYLKSKFVLPPIRIVYSKNISYKKILEVFPQLKRIAVVGPPNLDVFP